MRTSPPAFVAKLKELDMFYQGKDQVHKTMQRLVKRLEKANIAYAIVGGLAVFFHEHRRATNDVDILLSEEGFNEFRKRWVGKNYESVPGGRGHRFVDRMNQVKLDILVTGFFPGSGKPGPIAYPDPEQVRETIKNIQVVNLTTLIQLKLAARRHQDFADVVSLIRAHQLDESFLDRLHPSIRSDYIECLEEKRREEEYEARQ
jgi:hypothetical protein